MYCNANDLMSAQKLHFLQPPGSAITNLLSEMALFPFSPVLEVTYVSSGPAT